MSKVREGTDPGRWIDIGLKVFGIGMVLYHLVNTQFFMLGGIEHRNVHLGFALFLIFLNSLRRGGTAYKALTLGFIVCSLGAVAYVGFFYEDLEMRAMFNSKTDLVVGILLIIVVLEGARRAFGNVLPLFAVCMVGYFFLGRFLPPPFQTAAVSPAKIISSLSIALTGIYGVALSVSASYIFLFVVFGTLLQTSGATIFFMELGRVVGGRLRSGPAVSSVTTSALMGTTTGSIGANIVTTGSFTIPLMKKAGYRPEQAAAIESAASNGGQIMPPVMGAAAFAMAAVTGFSYLRIVQASIIPAVLYFCVVGLYTVLQASKLRLSPIAEDANKREMLLRAPLFLVPVGLIVYLLIQGKPLMYCAFWAIFSAVILSLPRKATRPSLGQWISGFSDGATVGAGIGVATACLGLIMESMTGTGLGIKLPALVEGWSGGNMLVALLLTAIASLILGMEVSTIGVYLLVAMVTAPILVKMGLGVLQAHFFVFFYAVFAMVTPPIGMAPIVASKIAKAKYIPTAVEAVKVSFAGFLLPFLVIWNPELLLVSSGLPLPVVLLKLLGCVILLTAAELGLVGHYLDDLKPWERILLGISGAAIVGHFITQRPILLFAGLALFAFITVEQFAASRQASKRKETRAKG